MPDELGHDLQHSGSPGSTPFSSGGGGHVFENKVQAGLLATLLVRGYTPVFEDALIEELHLQCEHKGFRTDDALVVGADRAGRSRRQLWAVKRGVTFTQSDPEFVDVLKDAWDDFGDPDRFNPELDAIILATSFLAAKQAHLLTLLETARAAATVEDFEARVEQPGFVSNHVRDYLRLFRKLSTDVLSREPSPEQLWHFLRRFHVLHYDFDRDASQAETNCRTLLSLAMRGGSGETGEELWNRILRWVSDGNARAKSFTRDSLPAEWLKVCDPVAPRYQASTIQRLREHTENHLKRIQTRLG